MPAAISANFGSGGSGLTPNQSAGEPDVAEALRSFVDDATEFRTKFIALLVKLDADTGLNDDDYESTLTPAALTLTKA